MWPKLTNIESNIHTKIKEYSNNVNVSNLNTWIRVISGADKGLILQSNTNSKLLSAAGQSDSIYGDSQSSGVIGKDWEGNVVRTTDTRFLRPSPIVTSFGVKEGKDQISREATLQLTAYSLEQLEVLQTYLMEPGYSLYIEWGWNVSDSYTQLTPIEFENLARTASNRNLNWEKLSEIRRNSNGTYDSFLGFVVGGNVSNSGENFSINITLRGTPSLPTYLQSHRNLSKIEGTTVKNYNKSVNLYSEAELISSDKPSLFRKFGNMFNQLPSYRQLESVKALFDNGKVSEKQFINFDKKISNEVVRQYEGAWYERLLNGTGVSSESVNVAEINSSIKLELLYSKNKYIRMDLATDILNEIGSEDYYNIGDKKVKFKIDISNCIIGGFPFMFSINPEKVLIPTKVPNFFEYFLQTSDPVQKSDGNLLINDIVSGPIIPDSVLDDFLLPNNLNNFGLKETQGYCGYLKYLFVNFDVFVSKLEQKNKNIREIYLDILNEISSGANSFWNFQIVEGEFTPSSTNKNTTFDSNSGFGNQNIGSNLANQVRRESALTETINNNSIAPFTTTTILGDTYTTGDIVITVIDENWIGEVPFPLSEVITFEHNGNGSPFMDSSLDMSIPSEMTNYIINKRLESTSNPDSPYLSVNDKSLFNSKKDLFLIQREDRLTQLQNEYQSSFNNTNSQSSVSGQSLQEMQDELNSLGVTERTIVTGQYSSVTEYYINGQTVSSNDSRIIQYKNLVSKKQAAVKTENEQKVSRVTTFLEKIDIVPKTTVSTIDKSLRTLASESNVTEFQRYFSIYCFRDSEYFDKLKNEQFLKKYEGNVDSTSTESTNLSLSHPLPIKYSFTIFGNSGIRRGDMFKIKGIPEKYSKKGVFQVTEIEHSVEGMIWKTTITGDYRQIQ